MSTAHDAHGDDHGHGHHGSPFIQHHYDDAQHQFDSGKLGDLAVPRPGSAVLLGAVRRVHPLPSPPPRDLRYAHKWLDVKYGAINTGVLIFSSLTAAWAVRCAQLNQRKGLIACIVDHDRLRVRRSSGSSTSSTATSITSTSCSAGTSIRASARAVTSCITKSNECPGSKGTVEVGLRRRQGRRRLLSRAARSIRTPHEPGVQADCTVNELKVRNVEGRRRQGHRDRAVAPRRSPRCARCGSPATTEAAKATAKATRRTKFPCWKPRTSRRCARI